MFDEDSASAWMRSARELARDTRTGRVLAAELAERCALAFGVAGEGGPLSNPAHWLHRVARSVADDVTLSPALRTLPGSELVVIRLRNHGRTYWMVSNGETTRTYAPHIAQRDAIARFEDDAGIKHARVIVHREHHKPEDAAALVAMLIGGC
jgi:hypothetical protein